MRMILSVAMIVYLSIGSAFADKTNTVAKTNITTTSGMVYSNVVVQRVEPDGLIIKRSSGIMKIPFADLSPEIKETYGYDPVKEQQAAEVAAAELRAQRARQAHQQQLGSIAERDFYGKIVSVIGDHVVALEQLVKYHAETVEGRGWAPVPENVMADEPIIIYGLPSNLVDGSYWKGKIYSADITQYKTAAGSVKTVNRYATSRELAFKLLNPAKE
jgi:hypothetical protein